MKASERATAFGVVADEYEHGRPTYPQAATRWLLERAPGRRVADVGSGTGKLTRSLVADGCVVTAIDPSPEMLAVLERELPGVRTVVGKTGARGVSFVYAAQRSACWPWLVVLAH